jgi:hypothetical protein
VNGDSEGTADLAPLDGMEFPVTLRDIVANAVFGVIAVTHSSVVGGGGEGIVHTKLKGLLPVLPAGANILLHPAALSLHPRDNPPGSKGAGASAGLNELVTPNFAAKSQPLAAPKALSEQFGCFEGSIGVLPEALGVETYPILQASVLRHQRQKLRISFLKLSISF